MDVHAVPFFLEYEIAHKDPLNYDAPTVLDRLGAEIDHNFLCRTSASWV
jgi:hypothetical protein